MLRHIPIFALIAAVITGCGMFEKLGGSSGDGGKSSGDATGTSPIGNYYMSPFTIGSCHGGTLTIKIQEGNQCSFSWHNILCSPSYMGDECTMDRPKKKLTLTGSFGYEQTFRYRFTKDTLILDEDFTLKKEQEK